MPGTESSSAKLDDPVLGAGMAELATEGFDPNAPTDSSTQDEAADATGANPDARPQGASDPATDGDVGPTANATQPAATAAQDSSTTDDPLAGAEPVTITVDGQTRTLDGFYRIPGDGIVIDEDRVPAFQLMASRAEGLERQNRELYQRTQEYDRLAQWTTKAPDGTEKTLTGREAIEARDVELARVKAWSQVVESALMNPEVFASLIAVDANGNVMPARDSLRTLAIQAELAARDASDAARSTFTQRYQSVTQEQQRATQQEQAPQQLWQTAEQAWGKDFPQLTGEDKTFLSSQVRQYMRAANTQEVQSGQFKPGELVLDPAFYAVMQDRANLRAQLAATATANTQANKFNAGQQAGRKSAPKPGQSPASTQQTPAAAPAKRSKQDAWDAPFQQAMQELTI